MWWVGPKINQDITVSLSTVDGTATGICRRKTVLCRIHVQKSESHNHVVVNPWCYSLGTCVHRCIMFHVELESVFCDSGKIDLQGRIPFRALWDGSSHVLYCQWYTKILNVTSRAPWWGSEFRNVFSRCFKNNIDSELLRFVWDDQKFAGWHLNISFGF